MAVKKHLLLIILIITSLAVHFVYFGRPNETVFDEVHFGKFISGYFTHEYFFDIHPPMGKLLISGVGYLSGFKPGFSFAQIGEKFPDNAYLWLRLLPTLAGALLPIIIFFLAIRLGISKFGSFATGIFIVLENSLLVQSRLILLDSFLLLFGFSALLCYFKFRDEKKLVYLPMAGILAVFSLSVKWTGASFLGLILILETIRLIKFRKETRLFRAGIRSLLSLVVLPFLIYFAIFAIHLRLLSKSGPGDAFMSPGFQKTLQGNYNLSNAELKTPNLFGKFIELNSQMYTSNKNLTATHPYSSQWYTWPFMVRPIYYWYHADQIKPGGALNESSRIYLLGNPAIWWLSTIAIFYGLLMWLSKLFLLRAKKIVIEEPFPLIILVGFLFNFLPFIGITRAMFLYHYMTGLIFAILALVCLLDKIKYNRRIFIALILISAVSFIYFAPLSYGLPLTEKQYNQRAWFSSWK